jgi:hypothetical protein
MTQYLISFGAHAMDHIPDEDAPAVARAARAAVQEAINAGVYVSAGGLENQPASIVATDGAVITCPGAPLKRWSGGINAAVDGGGTFKSFGYMFREDRYLRFNWNPAGGGDPRADQPPASIQDNWLGLAELLVAGQAKTQALAWTKAARSQLTAFLAFLSAGTPFPSDMKVFNTALATHFHVPPGASSSVKAAAVRQIRTAFPVSRGRCRKAPRGSASGPPMSRSTNMATRPSGCLLGLRPTDHLHAGLRQARADEPGGVRPARERPCDRQSERVLGYAHPGVVRHRRDRARARAFEGA